MSLEHYANIFDSKPSAGHFVRTDGLPCENIRMGYVYGALFQKSLLACEHVTFYCCLEPYSDVNGELS